MNHDGENLCASLDAYLEGDMPAGAAAEFEAHLSECPECAEAVGEQNWIDGLLRSPTAATLESAPKTAIRTELRRRRQRRLAAVAAMAAALAATAAWPLLPLPGREGLGEGTATLATATMPHSDAAVANPSPGPSFQVRGIAEAAFVSSSDAIAVPLASPAANVTIVQVYPTVDAQRRLRLAAAVASISSEPNGG